MPVLSQNNVVDEILSEIESIGIDRNLYLEKNFNARTEAIDYLDLHVIDRLHALMETTETPDRINFLIKYAIKVRSGLESVNESMFQILRLNIIRDSYRGKLLMELIEEHFEYNVNLFLQQDITGYDNLDIFINGLLSYQNPPIESREREPGMIYYQTTPARIILELIKRAEFKPQDVFFDLGSGLGHVSIMVNLLTSVVSKGVEFEPAFCTYAGNRAVDLHLNEVEFFNADARYADYSSGTIFFMYSPFEGKMLEYTLQKLKSDSKKKRIKVFTYGPCSTEVAKQNWLINKYKIQTRSGEFCEFHSV